jgi:hypothetical protein
MAKKDAELTPIMTRIPEGLRKNLEAEAKKSGRSMNAEIINRLSRSFERQGLLDEVLRLAYGDEWAAFLVSAHKHGVLSIDAQGREHMRKAINNFIDDLPSKKGKK